jgi:hypothetical protein
MKKLLFMIAMLIAVTSLTRGDDFTTKKAEVVKQPVYDERRMPRN